jgi:hypothetical protein
MFQMDKRQHPHCTPSGIRLTAKTFMPTSVRHGLAPMAVSLLMLAACSGSDSTDANIRLLNVSHDYDSLDLYVDSNQELSGVSYDAVSPYAGIKDTTYTIGFDIHGVSSTLESLVETLPTKSHKTYVAYGDTGNVAISEISEDQSTPDSGSSRLQVLNTATDAGALDVYLTGSTVSLDNASPTFNAVTSGSIDTDGFVTLNSGSYRLRVTATGSKSDVRLDVSDVSFDGGQVISIVVSGTSGGVLVDAMILPQQGSLAIHKNPNARVRAAAGITSGTAITASIEGVSLLTSAAANTVSSYTQVPAGTDAVSLSVDRNAVAGSGQTLSAGSDYTLLIWNNTGGIQVTLSSDDNRLPPRNDAKMRLINAMSGLSDPISLAVNYSPITLGTASGYSDVTAASNVELIVTDAATSTSLFANTATSLDAQEVYTLFMFGSSSSVTEILRADR